MKATSVPIAQANLPAPSSVLKAMSRISSLLKKPASPGMPEMDSEASRKVQ